jgi:RNA polymerase sigma-70 factor (ECF subfamily)
MESSTAPNVESFGELEQHRRELTAHCYRMLGSPFEAEDAVQDTLLRGWRSIERFEGRSSLRSWLYTIATNVCLDMLDSKQRRARPMDLGEARSPDGPIGEILPETTWIEPVPDVLVSSDGGGDPATVAQSRESIRLAFVAALQHLPPRQRAALILCEVLHWKAAEVAELLDTSVAAVNSSLQRARATLETAEITDAGRGALSEQDSALLGRYVEAFQSYDMDALTSLIHEDATQSMPPYELWLRGRKDILSWWVGKGAGCRGSRVIATQTANGSPAFAQYKPREDGREGYEPWALQVLEIADGKIVEMTFFLSTETIFPLFGVPLDYAELAVVPKQVRPT